MNDIKLKENLLNHCVYTIDQRYEKVKKAISDIEESLLEESKSSAGDKHETGRAMLQIDREHAGKQLREIEQLKAILPKIDHQKKSAYARLGSLVYTSQGAYFLSLSIGAVVVGKTTYMCISISSPIGQQLLGKTKGDVFTFQQKEVLIKSIS
jgi:hypothetical protein